MDRGSTSVDAKGSWSDAWSSGIKAVFVELSTGLQFQNFISGQCLWRLEGFDTLSSVEDLFGFRECTPDVEVRESFSINENVKDPPEFYAAFCPFVADDLTISDGGVQ